jgi:sulfite reductase (NADPH) hemoprotein beta-component
MYRYDVMDKTLVAERVAEFRDQTRRFLAGELSDEEFKHLRLRNGLYIQTHAPMLRVAIPYGLLSSTQLRMLGSIARRYDRGYGHFTTRQNIQYNWPKLETAPDILADLVPSGIQLFTAKIQDCGHRLTPRPSGVAGSRYRRAHHSGPQRRTRI